MARRLRVKMNIKPGIRLIEEVKGSGEVARKGDVVEVRLNGWLNEGEQIQSDYIVSIILGGRKLIPGIEYAIEGMKVKGVRKVIISPHLGYKEDGVDGLIPPNALLIYEIELLGVE